MPRDAVTQKIDEDENTIMVDATNESSDGPLSFNGGGDDDMETGQDADNAIAVQDSSTEADSGVMVQDPPTERAPKPLPPLDFTNDEDQELSAHEEDNDDEEDEVEEDQEESDEQETDTTAPPGLLAPTGEKVGTPTPN
eukprot:TRINITY_DN66271_c5_g1_i1.p1 TRINITY_DN66271_c5_g1~~TRINITY_DN66271_c5_g1_i1.p1  ORF type:complete len:162 (+),score=41.37 TRINITY_DN66271_c5_g1_i1:72-488(+)